MDNENNMILEKKTLFSELLEILYEIDRVCKKNNITYYAFAGTLLGAVRHGGFIPWDDDIDLLMFREDYTRFIDACGKDLDSNYFLQTTMNEEVYYRYPARLRKNNTTCFGSEDVRRLKAGKSIPYNCGLFVSIFPLDTMPKNRILYRIQKMKALFRNRLLLCNAYSNRKKVSTKLVHFYCSIVGYKNIYRRFEKSYSKYSIEAGELIHFPAIYKNARCTSYYSEDFKEIIFLPFEGFDMPCPIGYSRCLSRAYGDDYMIPPPPEERGKHHHGDYINLYKGYKDMLDIKRSELIGIIDDHLS